ncbi:FIST N-terminal domain-containing protein [uncultured Roseibium sp.]|uniref:FIST N-terminal domain-containing protein n=1 Tax=uncultured Roseibium sp. TaxID=1936171 RepID=UPI0032173452
MNILPLNKAGQPLTAKVGVSHARDPEEAVREASMGFATHATCFVLVFVPDHLEPAAVAREMAIQLPSTTVFGCTTAGQITTKGYENDALMMIAFPRRHFRCSSTLIKPLRRASIERTAAQARMLASRFPHTANWKRVALVFADGLSKQEDLLVAALNAGLCDVPVFGGSAGHGLAFDETFVLHEGEAHSDAALLLLLETDLCFRALGFDHFLPTAKRMVVTRAIPEERLVLEINGAPAAREYARYVGCQVSELSPKVFAENPVLVRNGKSWHVRAIQQVADNGGLWFLSAIDDGLVLTLGQGTEILETLETGLDTRCSKGNSPDFILGFDCYLRRLEIEQNNLVEDASDILCKHRVFGFNTYGEQHLGVHVNQTFVGVAFYPPTGDLLF